MDVPPRLIGQSPQIRSVEADIDCAASSDVTVLITGERGVGKEIVARLVHHRGKRCAKPLISLNCTGIRDTRLACELFGHVRGSFTDAHRDAEGLLEAADNGTIFLDEVGEISLRVQSLLLHFLAGGAIQRVGSSRLLKNTRIGLFSWPSCVSRPPPTTVRTGTRCPDAGASDTRGRRSGTPRLQIPQPDQSYRRWRRR